MPEIRLARRESARIVLALLVAMGIYASIATWLASGEALFCGDIGVKYIQMSALAQNQRAIPNPAAEFDPDGALFPLKAPFVIQADGQFYSVYLNPYVQLGSYAYRLGGPVLCRALTLVCTLAAGFASILLARRLGAAWNAACAVAALTLFATPLWLYGCCFWEHAPAVLCATLALAFLRESKWSLSGEFRPGCNRWPRGNCRWRREWCHLAGTR